MNFLTAARSMAVALVIALAVYGGWSLATSAADVFAQEPNSPSHQQMHEMMDSMMGAGASERMHEAMPGSEEMMEQCVQMIAMMSSMDGMMGADTMDATMRRGS